MAKKAALAYTLMCEAMMADYVARTHYFCRIKATNEQKSRYEGRTIFTLDTDSREKVDEATLREAREVAELWKEKAGDLRGEDCCVILESRRRTNKDPGGIRIAIGKRDGRRVWDPGKSPLVLVTMGGEE